MRQLPPGILGHRTPRQEAVAAGRRQGGPPELSLRWRGLQERQMLWSFLASTLGSNPPSDLPVCGVGHSISSLCASVSPFVKQGQQLSNVM